MFEFTDRYKALGIPYPDPETMCLGDCEGVGVYPHRRQANETAYEVAAWQAAHDAPDAHKDEECDGYHFIKCPDCNGTGKRQLTATSEASATTQPD